MEEVFEVKRWSENTTFLLGKAVFSFLSLQ